MNPRALSETGAAGARKAREGEGSHTAEAGSAGVQQAQGQRAASAPVSVRSPLADLQGQTHREQSFQDSTTSAPLTQGLERTATPVAPQHAEHNRNEKHVALHRSFGGLKLPKGVDMHQLRAAREIAGALGTRVKGAVGDHLSNAAAGLQAIEPQVIGLVSRMVANLERNPAALEGIAHAIKRVGAKDFGGAAMTAGPGIANAFTEATGRAMMNPEAIQAALAVLGKMGPKCVAAAAKLGGMISAAGTTALTGSAAGAKLAPALGAAAKLAPALGAAAAKLGVAGTTALQGAAGAAKLAPLLGGTTKLAVTGAKTGGKVAPMVGNAISIASTLHASAKLVGQIFQRPFSFEKVAKEAVHTLAQAAGAFFPPIALGGDMLDLAWGAKVQHGDEKRKERGEQTTANASIKDVVPFLTEGAAMLEEAFTGAGKPEHAKTVRALRDASRAIEENPADPTEQGLLDLKRKQESAALALADGLREGLDDASGATQDPVERESLQLLARAAGQLWKAGQKSRVVERHGGDDGKRTAAAAEVVGSLTTLASADAARVAASAPAHVERSAD